MPHCVFFLDEQSKLNLIQPENVEKVISAEIPSVDEDANLRECILSNMIHSPCGYRSRGAPCMERSKRSGEHYCKKKLPRQRRHHTAYGDNGS